MTEPLPLDAEIRARIARNGPMAVADFMALCLYDPEHGYYSRRVPFGAAGDFVTAPEISQMFGEMVAVWAVGTWDAIGRPNPFALIECGPGRGTLMKDFLRASRSMAPFRNAMRVHLVETSAGLRQLQRETLNAASQARPERGGTEVPLQWHTGIGGVPVIPSIIVANEFFDALPVRQAVRRPAGWHERMVTADAGGALTFVAAPAPLSDPPATLPAEAPLGAIYEWRPPEAAAAIAGRAAAGGAALVIDYGHVRSAPGDTFQAVQFHRYADPLASPGLSDITAHVDFEALSGAARGAGARVHGPVEQATFLQRMGIAARAARLQANAGKAKGLGIAADLLRLTGRRPGEMGALFKAIAFSAPEIEHLPGFEPTD
jgi:NADH dehydrogenase [ubiquinone] 1 alpha subcomplex assembly factor 7